MKPLQYYANFAPALIGAALFFFIALAFWVTGRRALTSARGGLDWVRNYRTDSFDFSYRRLTCSDRDKLVLFAVIVFALIFSALEAFLRSRYDTGSWFSEFYSIRTLARLVIFTAGAFATCWLLQDIFDDNTLALCGSLLFAASFITGHTAISLLMCSLAFFLRWFVTDDDAPLFPRILLLVAADLLLAMAASRMIGLTWIAVLYLALHIHKSVRRFNAGTCKLWELIVLPIIGILLWLVAIVVSNLGVMFLLQRANFTNFLKTGVILRMLLRPLRVPAMILNGRLNFGLLLYPLADAPLLMLGFFGFFVALRAAIDRHEPYALICVIVTAVLLLVWAFTRQYCLLPALVLCTVCLLRRFAAAEKKIPIIIYTVLGCLYYIALYLLTYLVPQFSALNLVLA